MMITPEYALDYLNELLSGVENSWIFILIVVMMLIIGAGFILYGIFLCVKHRITMIPRRFRSNVKPADSRDMTAMAGCATVIQGLGFLLGGITGLSTGSILFCGLAWLITFSCGCFMYDRAVKNYNDPKRQKKSS